MIKELKLFKELFTPCINIAILYINNSSNFVETSLNDIKEQNKGKLKQVTFIDDRSTKLKVAREYEYIVLEDIFYHCEDKITVLKNMYKALENSGNIIILEKKEYSNKNEILELLEKVGFQVANTIELFEEFELICAKKMHNWDNGL